MIGMGLQSEFYYYMLNGNKRIEVRLYDDKRKNSFINELEKYYPKDKQLKYGIIGIRIELLQVKLWLSMIFLLYV